MVAAGAGARGGEGVGGGTHATRQSLLMVSASKCAECKQTMQSVWLLVPEAMSQEHDVTPQVYKCLGEDI